MRSISIGRTGGLFLAAATLALAAQPASAQTQKLKCRLVTQAQPVGSPLVLPEIGGHKVTVGEYTGVAVCDDGRLAQKHFVDVSDDTPNDGVFKGYSTYTFQNGDALTVGYTGGWDANAVKGDYVVISGTGAYAGTTGKGGFTAVTEEKWEQAYLWDVWFELNTATN